MHTIHHPVRAKPQNQPTDRHREALNCAARSSFITGAWRATCIHVTLYVATSSDKPYFVRIARALELCVDLESTWRLSVVGPLKEGVTKP
ncbi:hypothetical protein MGG_15664 [Pyricularia oryzae 70-15]|uniref:Uncharacterized protein n=1 Tax=Pyricularia oryzae (strain 70-15 / ATCC MYA-4617 / FGSC 8958) TaxID=242507 RepID=G4MY70_PYRO7|nr:uncharacterized protein MGG_15664 [Pyricularia oryzae 70-15]EHA54401.1 hypothetical protein MGG_15664 [Pyricularia oryzae 70-15]